MENEVVAVAVVRGPWGVLVGRRTDRTPPWVFVGGKIEPGETPQKTAVREAAEEAGVRAVARAEIGRRPHPRTGRLVVYVDCWTDNTDLAVTAPEEVDALGWVDPGDLDRLMPDLFNVVREHLHSDG